MKKLNGNINAILITVQMACEKTNLSKDVVLRLARECGAHRKIGKSSRIDWTQFYNYISEFKKG